MIMQEVREIWRTTGVQGFEGLLVVGCQLKVIARGLLVYCVAVLS